MVEPQADGDGLHVLKALVKANDADLVDHGFGVVLRLGALLLPPGRRGQVPVVPRVVVARTTDVVVDVLDVVSRDGTDRLVGGSLSHCRVGSEGHKVTLSVSVRILDHGIEGLDLAKLCVEGRGRVRANDLASVNANAARLCRVPAGKVVA